MDYSLRWTNESVKNLEEILNYITSNFTDNEVYKFKSKLIDVLDLISKNPLMFPSSNFYPNFRKAVISKQTTLFYVIEENIIYLIHLHLNSKDIYNL
jgi:plasmid stabilization system protein ParE